IRCSLPPGISATPAQATARRTAHNPITTTHLPPPTPEESASRDWTQRPSGPGPPSPSPPTLPTGNPGAPTRQQHADHQDSGQITPGERPDQRVPETFADLARTARVSRIIDLDGL